MTNSFVEQTRSIGQELTADWGNHVQTQADCIEDDLAAGNLPIAAPALTGTINKDRLPTAVKPIFLSAAGGTPNTTNGCAPAAKLELPTNDIMVVTQNFDASTQEYDCWGFVLPDGYNAGTFIPRFYWTAASGTAGNTVVWGIQGRSFGDGESLDQALGTAVEASDAYQSANALHIITGAALTIAGTPAGGEWVVFKAYRKQGTLAVDAKLLGVYLEYTGAYSD